MLVDNLAKTQPMLVEEVVPKLYSYGDLQKILAGLLRENIPIKNLSTILETLADSGSTARTTEELVEKVRQNLGRVITHRFLENENVSVVVLDSSLEQLIIERTRKTDSGNVVILEPAQLQQLLMNTKEIVEHAAMQGKKVIVLTSSAVRPRFKSLLSQTMPDLTVLSYNEVTQNFEIHIDGVINLGSAA